MKHTFKSTSPSLPKSNSLPHKPQLERTLKINLGKLLLFKSAKSMTKSSKAQARLKGCRLAHMDGADGGKYSTNLIYNDFTPNHI